MSFGLLKLGSALALAALFASGCYVDSQQTPRAPTTGDGTRDDLRLDGGDASLCRTTFAKGCFDGYVLSKKEFFVDGKQFFNADDLAARFTELVKVDGKSDYALTLATMLDNQSFLQGFEYVLTGELVRSGKVRTNGSFAVNELPEGQYDLRVQRAVRFSVSHQVVKEVPAPQTPATPATPATPIEPQDGEAAPQPVVEPAQPQATTQTETVTQAYCATIYADTVVDVRRGKRVSEPPFTDFRLHVTDYECDAAGKGSTISLRD